MYHIAMRENETATTETGAKHARGGDRIRVAEIAERLDVGRLLVYDMLEARQIPAVRVGRKWIIARAAFERWLASAGTTKVA
jgi:excisionase family DNA binding protein